MDIQLEDLRFGRPAGFALGPLTLTVPTGQRLALVGPSGCGKTTLLRLLAGLERPAGGRVLLGGRVASDGATLRLPPNERQLGFVFQDGALWPHLDATAHLRFCDPTLSVDAARALLAQVGLADHASKRPAQLSGGEQQRLALARALVGSPRALLLDEPLHSVDVHLRDGLAVAIRAQAQARSLTTVVVTHDRDEALAIADHVIVLRAGQLVEQGAAAAILRDPRTAFGAAFVAGATCLPAARAADGTLRTAFGAFPAPSPSGSFVLALLPGDAAITADGPARGVVLQVLPSLGGATAKVQLDGRTLTVAATPDLVAGTSVALALRRPPRLLPDDGADLP